uniref:Uncharacterized protein n=1 Tax=Panagrolaimus sp. PS1159 TaxID=55785 RepID=A0AC35GQW7_9BILA
MCRNTDRRLIIRTWTFFDKNLNFIKNLAMTAVVASMSNNMVHEYDKEISSVASTKNEIAQDNGAESKLKSKEDVEMIPEPTLESMGLQREAEDDPIVENLTASKVSSKRKSTEKGETKYCEKLLGEINEHQQEAINRISRPGGLLQMKKWLETARSEEQPKQLGLLLAQCWKAQINKWKQAVEDDEMKKVNASKKAAASAPMPATAASKSASVPKPSSSLTTSKPQSSAPIISKVEKKTAVVPRPKTARTKNTAFRKTGFEEDEEESRAPAPKKPAPTMSSQLSTPITKPTVSFPKKSPVVSNSFMNALSSGSSVNAMEIQRRKKKPPPVIDLPLSSPLDPIVITPTTTTASVAGTLPPSDPLGPDPTRVPAPGARRRIHFADDKGEALVHTKFIENVLNNKAHRPNSDMKHADAEAERISLKQMKTDVHEEDEDDEMRMEVEMPQMGDTEVDSSWRLIPYYINAQNRFSQDLIDEEEARHGNV